MIAADVRRCPGPDVYGGARAVVYCAWNTRQRGEQEQRAHVKAAANWARLARDTDRTFLFTSTTSANRETVSSYGHHKLMAEDAIRESGGIALRIGLIVDDAYPFLATAIRRAVGKLPYLAPGLDLPVFAVSTTTLAAAIAAEIEEPRPGAAVWLAPGEPTPLSTVASWGTRRPSRTMPILRWLATGSTVFVKAKIGGHYLDALAGLRDSRFPTSQIILSPRTGRVAYDDWQQCLTTQ